MRREPTAWLIVVLLVVGVLVPTSTVVWLINESVQRETGAAQQTLLAAYREQLRLIRGRIDGFWSERARILTQYAVTDAVGFQRIVAAGLADSVVIVDNQGVAVYPRTGTLTPVPDSADLRARTAQSVIRDRLKNGDRSGALATIERDFIDGMGTPGHDADGRLIAADELLLAIHLVHPGDRRGPAFADRLTALVNRYDVTIPSAQRLFLMDEITAWNSSYAANRFPTLAAERLAASFLESDSDPDRASGFHRTRLPNVWALTPSSGRVLALYRTASIRVALDEIVAQSSSTVVRFMVMPPDAAVTDDAVIASTLLPDWHIAFTITDRRPAQAVVRRRIATNVWVGFVAIAVIAGVAILLGRSVQHQVRVTRLKTDLVAAVSHELKTPLSSMRLLVDALLEDNHLDEVKTREYLRLIANENQRLSRVIDNFLTFSRIERNRLQLAFAAVTPAHIVALVMEAMRERFPSAPTHILVETEPGLPTLRADDHALVMALLNLLDNAYKYTARRSHDPPADLSRRRSDRVCGAGQWHRHFSGRAGAHLWPVLPRRRQTGRPRRRIRSRAGDRRLHRAVARRRRHGRERAGCGQHIHAVGAVRHVDGSRGMSAARILIVEDEAPLLRGLVDMFEGKGYRVTSATDGRIGLELALSSSPDLILLDIMLPNTNGYEICRAVRDRGLQMPIVMLTAKGQERDVILGLNLGADDYVTKPFRIAELVARVSAFLRRREAGRPLVCRFGPFALNLAAHRLFRDGTAVDLTAKEFKLLSYFVERRGCALTRDDILNAVWGHSVFVTPRSVDRCVATLRAKIDSDDRPFIETIRDVGYRFDPPSAETVAK